MRALFALSFLIAALFAPAASYVYAGTDDDKISAKQAKDDCYILLHGDGLSVMNHKQGQCDHDPDPFALVHEWMAYHDAIHWAADKVRAANRVPGLEHDLEVASNKLRDADEDKLGSAYVTRVHHDNMVSFAAWLTGVCALFLMTLIAMFLGFAWRAEYRRRVKAERRN